MKINHNNREEETDNNYGEILTDDIEELKLLEMSSQSEIENINKKYHERDRIDDDCRKNSDERDQMGERQADEI